MLNSTYFSAEQPKDIKNSQLKQELTFYTPVLIIPDFDLSPYSDEVLQQAVISITKGYQSGDRLELDSHITVNKKLGIMKIANTNIEIQDGGFNPTTRQLILKGEDSLSNYESLLESLILETITYQAQLAYQFNFKVVDAKGISHILGDVIVNKQEHIHKRPTLFQELQCNELDDHFFSDATSEPEDWSITLDNTLIYHFRFDEEKNEEDNN